MAQCEYFPKGNVVTWERNKFKINKAEVKVLHDRRDICRKPKKLFMFPRPVLLKEARYLCFVHGGKIFTPESEEENKNLISLANQFKSKCENKQQAETKNIAWLGIERRNNVFIYENDNGQISPAPPNYSNWMRQPPDNKDIRCSYLLSGLWSCGLCLLFIRRRC